MVAGRGADRPAGHDDLCLGREGKPPAAPRDQRYKWAYIFGAVCPARQAAAGLVLPKANAAMMNLHLAEIATQVAPGAYAVIVYRR